MKKAIAIIILGLFWCNIGFALSQDSAISQYLSDRKLESIEGIWIADLGRVSVIYKQGSNYYCKVIQSAQLRSGQEYCQLTKGSSSVYYGKIYEQGNTAKLTVSVGQNSARFTNTWEGGTNSYNNTRIWPESLSSHNAKFKTKKDIADEEKVVADMVADAKKTCKVLGFEDGSEKFSDCTLKLYTQKVDELVAEKVAADTRMMQSQTTTTTQSSGSSSVTIYDPVRDSRALMKQGQRMLSGACTFGIDC